MSDNQPLVSVIITAYNEEVGIKKALQSVLNQTYKNLEVIVFTDGCTDSTALIVSEQAEVDTRVVLLESLENVGKGKGRNSAMEKAQGEFYAIFDADDYMHPQRIEKQIQFLQAHPGVSVLGTQLNYINKVTRVTKATSFPLEHSQIWKAPFKGIAIANPSSMIRKEVFEVCRFKESLIYAQDYDFWFQAHYQGFIFANHKDILVDYSYFPVSKWKSTKFQLKVKFYWLKKGNFPLLKSLSEIMVYFASVMMGHLVFTFNQRK